VHQITRDDWEARYRELELRYEDLESSCIRFREATRRRIRRSRDTLRLVAEHLDDAVFVHDLDSGTTWLSGGFERIWGVEGLPGRREPTVWLDGVHAEDRARVISAAQRLPSNEPVDEEFRVVQPGGDIRTVIGRGFCVDAANGSTVVAGIVHDVTVERQAVEHLRQAQRVEAIGAFAGGVAHDFNNLLSGILGCLRSARRPGVDEEKRDLMIERAEEAVIRGAELVGRLEAVGRGPSGPPGRVAVDEALEAFTVLLRRLVGDSVRLEVVAGAPGALVRGRLAQLERILLNLAANARDAMPNGGLLTLRSEPVTGVPGIEGGEAVMLEVQDTGCGMTDEVRHRLFQPYFTTKRPGKGTGLGMTAVLSVVVQLGGRIKVKSTVGAGTRVRLYLPRAD